MISLLKRYKFQSDLQAHPNYNFKPTISAINLGSAVGIVSDLTLKNEVEKFIKSAVDPLASVSVLYSSESSDEHQDTYNVKEVSWCGVPKSEIVADFLKKEYDRFFFLDTKMENHQEYICELAKYRLSVGPIIASSDFAFDLSIQLEDMNVKKLFAEIKEGIQLLSNMP